MTFKTTVRKYYKPNSSTEEQRQQMLTIAKIHNIPIEKVSLMIDQLKLLPNKINKMTVEDCRHIAITKEDMIHQLIEWGVITAKTENQIEAIHHGFSQTPKKALCEMFTIIRGILDDDI